jgi:hypothetical protein
MTLPAAYAPPGAAAFHSTRAIIENSTDVMLTAAPTVGHQVPE